MKLLMWLDLQFLAIIPMVSLRVVSLLPSATENVCALLSRCRRASAPQLVGRSHECDFPASALCLPALTAARTSFRGSADTHDQVRAALASAASLYKLDEKLLVALKPDVILTQSTCKVCSIDLASVEAAVSGQEVQETKEARIVTTNPTGLEEALVTQFQQLGRALGAQEEGDAIAQEHKEKLEELKALAETMATKRPRVLMVEWLEPLFLGTKGWMREIVEAAGGDVVDKVEDVDVVIVALCGLTLESTEKELVEGRVGDWWKQITGKKDVPGVYIVDGTSMFTRPTSRLLLALEWLVHVLHEPHSNWLKEFEFPYKKFDPALVKQSTGSVDGETKTPEMLEIEELHRVACETKQAMYTDPATGYSVMTAYILKERQVCCGNGCRHCPYGHANVKDPSRRKNKLAGDAFLQPRRRSKGFAKDAPGGQLLWPEGVDASSGDTRDLVVMFWSGGKDSFLALSYLYQSYADEQKPMPRVVLLTMIDPDSNSVPIQNISSQTIAAQAEALELPLCLVAVGLGDAYTAAVRNALLDIPQKLSRTKKGAANGATLSISAVVFGDLHLEDIRAWREQTFGDEYNLRFPVWKKDYQTELLPALSRLCANTGAKISFSNVDTDRLGDGTEWRVGQDYDWKRVEQRNEAAADAVQIDLMGESGEFHTCVKFPGME